MRTIRLTITTLILSVSSLALGNAALAHGYDGKAAYRDHGHHQRHTHVPRYPSSPRAYGHDHYQHKHHGMYKKNRHYRHFGKVSDWRRHPHRFNDRRSHDSGYGGHRDSDGHRGSRDAYGKDQAHNRHGRDHSKRIHTTSAAHGRH